MLPNFFEYSFLGFSFFLIFFLSHRAWTHFFLDFHKRVFCEKMRFFTNKCVLWGGVWFQSFFIENEKTLFLKINWPSLLLGLLGPSFETK